MNEKCLFIALLPCKRNPKDSIVLSCRAPEAPPKEVNNKTATANPGQRVVAAEEEEEAVADVGGGALPGVHPRRDEHHFLQP